MVKAFVLFRNKDFKGVASLCSHKDDKMGKDLHFSVLNENKLEQKA